MAHIYILLLSFFLYQIDSVPSVVYSCDRNAQCGCSKSNAALSKIVGGESAVDSSWGWAVSFQRSSTNSHFCGGAIISPLHILTAAHCVTNVSFILGNTKIVVGLDQLSQRPSTVVQERSIARVISHPQYNDDSKANDIAILRLNQPLNISYEKGTARLCLPHVVPENTTNNYPAPGSTLVAIGWGVLQSGASSIPSNLHLQQATLRAMSSGHQMCRPTIKNRQLQFCAGVVGGGKDTCQGDSGGPLMYFDPNERRWILTGVVSYGVGCALPDYAGVYTRVSVYRSWLQSVVTDQFIELTVNGTSFTAANLARHTLSPYYLILLSLYLFVQI